MTCPRRLVVAVSTVVTMAVAAGCGTSGSHRATPSSTAASTTAPASTSAYDPGAGLALAVGAEPAQWNCDAAGVDQASCLAVVDDVWPSVYRLDATGQPQLDTSFVTSASVTSTSPQTVVYHLNPKATWSDGTPVTWQDFAYSWQAQSGSAAYHDVGGAAFTPATTAGYDDIASVTGAPSDPRTVTVTFAQPDPDWQALFGAGDPLLPAHVAERVGFDHGFTDPVTDLVSAGPYLVSSAVPGRSVTLVRNPGWWGTAAALSSVTVRFTTSPDELPTALQYGIVGAAEVTGDPGSLVDADTYDDLKKLSGVDVKAAAGSTFEDLRLDPATPALADPALRQAILTAIDRSALLKLVPAAADASIDPLGDRFALPGSSAYTDDTPTGDGSGDVASARRALQAAGYVAQPGSPLTKGGQAVTLRLTATAGVPGLATQEQAIIADLAGLGITVTEDDTTDLAATLAGTEWDLALTTVDAVPFPATALAGYAASLPAGTASAGATSAPGSTGQALTAAAGTLDPTRRATLLHQVDVDLWAGAGDLPLFQLPVVLAYRSDVGGAAPAVGAEGPTADLATWGITRSS